MQKENLCKADELEKIINNTPDGGVCCLEKKNYFLKRRVVIENKKDIIIDGNGAQIITQYINSKEYKESADAILIRECKGVTIKNLTFDCSSPPNITAKVVSVDRENKNIIIKVFDEFEINGQELMMALNSADNEGSFNYHIQHYSLHPDPNIVTLIQDEILLANTYYSAKNEYLGGNRFKIYLPVDKKYEKLTVGETICIRHSMYGPSLITIRQSDDTLLKDITIFSAPGMGIMVFPRSNNLTVDTLNMIKKEGSNVLMSGNCDGIHLTGLSGKFIMRNCIFDSLGDDALNVHSTAATVTQIIESEKIKCNYCKKTKDGQLSEKWCSQGDIIKVFEPKSMEHKATLKVLSFKDGILTFKKVFGEVKSGYELQNMAFAPSCLIDGCTVKNTRARAFMIQTNDVEIKNCYLFGMSASAIKAAPAFEYWHEVGPVENLYIHDNVIEKCTIRDLKAPDIAVFTCHDENDDNIKKLHKNICIENNRFKRCDGLCIKVSSAEGVTIKNNTFENRKNKEINPVQVVSSTDVTLYENKDV